MGSVLMNKDMPSLQRHGIVHCLPCFGHIDKALIPSGQFHRIRSGAIYWSIERHQPNRLIIPCLTLFSRLIPPHRKSTVTKKTQFPHFSFPVSLQLLTSPASAADTPGMRCYFFHLPFTLLHGIRRNGFHKIQPYEKTFRDSLSHDHGGSSEGLWQKSIIAAQNPETDNRETARYKTCGRRNPDCGARCKNRSIYGFIAILPRI